jgi:predicted dienelactone hydrolase
MTRALVAAAVALALTSCGSGSSDSSTSGANAAVAAGSEPRYAKPGPYQVGVTTIELADRKVEVYYPARSGSTNGRPAATYDQTDPIPPELLASLPKIPAGVDLTVTFPAVRDVPVATDGPFPVVLFSHGAGGWRGVYSHPLSGIASWGFVVASTDYAEYGLLAQFGGGGGSAADDRSTVAGAATATIDALAAANGASGGPFRGAIDIDRIGGVGHSAGGGTMFTLLNDSRIGAIVGWAPVPPTGPVTSHTPTMVIAGAEDTAITPASAAASYDALLAPKRFVEIAKMGHNAFSDACLAIRSGTDLIGLAKQLGIGIPDRLLALGRNGCEASSLDTRQGWRVIQHFTVAELRDALGVDRVPVGLAPGVATAFPGVTITYRQQLR